MFTAEAQVLLILVATSLLVSGDIVYSSGEADYCDPNLCRLYNGTHIYIASHIACGNNGSLDPGCGDVHMIEMNQRRVNLLLDLHNAARNRIAVGKLPGYQSAASMPVLKWDKELEYLASLNVRTCRFAHDSCHNTYRFSYSGQNIGIIWQTRPIRSISRRIKYLVGKWFYEYPDANQDFISAYKNHPDGKKIGHFTLMVADKVQRVGCAAVRFASDPLLGYRFLLTCNYDYTNISNGRVYATGLPASNCTGRPSGRYQGLCDWDEDYDDSEESDEIDSNFLDIPTLL